PGDRRRRGLESNLWFVYIMYLKSSRPRSPSRRGPGSHSTHRACAQAGRDGNTGTHLKSNAFAVTTRVPSDRRAGTFLLRLFAPSHGVIREGELVGWHEATIALHSTAGGASTATITISRAAAAHGPRPNRLKPLAGHAGAPLTRCSTF